MCETNRRRRESDGVVSRVFRMDLNETFSDVVLFASLLVPSCTTAP